MMDRRETEADARKHEAKTKWDCFTTNESTIYIAKASLEARFDYVEKRFMIAILSKNKEVNI